MGFLPTSLSAPRLNCGDFHPKENLKPNVIVLLRVDLPPLTLPAPLSSLRPVPRARISFSPVQSISLPSGVLEGREQVSNCESHFPTRLRWEIGVNVWLGTAESTTASDLGVQLTNWKNPGHGQKNPLFVLRYVLSCIVTCSSFGFCFFLLQEKSPSTEDNSLTRAEIYLNFGS